MRLDMHVDALDAKSLEAALRHWGADRPNAPWFDLEPRQRLKRMMAEPTSVQELLSNLPPRLHQLYSCVLREADWTRPLDLESLDLGDIDLASHELHAAGSALAERGFLHMGRVRRSPSQRDVRYEVPEELGVIAAGILHGANSGSEFALSLKRRLRFADPRRLERFVALGSGARPHEAGESAHDLALAEGVGGRLALIEDPATRTAVEAAIAAGGILDGDARRRLGIDAAPESLAECGRQLDALFLGGFGTPDLVNAGVSVRDGWLFAFLEIVDTRLVGETVDQDAADATMQRGPDFLADVGNLLRELEARPLRVTRAGEPAKASLKKLERRVFSPGYRAREPQADIQFLGDFLRRHELTSNGHDGLVRPLPKAKEWERKPAIERLEDGLRFCNAGRAHDMSGLHAVGLHKAILHELSAVGVGLWVSMARPALMARNRWLRETVRPEYARRYQEVHKHAPFPQLATPESLQRAALNWLLDGPCRLGMLDVAVRAGESVPWAIRLTPTGGALLGIAALPEPGSAAQTALVVNPDLEIVVFPEAAGHIVIQEVARFASRVKADFSVHFRLSRESVQSAAAGGMAAGDMIEVLATASGRPVPTNVDFQIRDWCSGVTPVGVRRVWLLETADVAAMERLLTIPELRSIVARRLQPCIVELRDDPSSSGLVAVLREQGAYISGTSHRQNPS